jgi:hypothetical protein
VHQIQVDHIDAEPAAAGLERVQRRPVAVVVVPQLGGDEDLLALQATRPQTDADVGLVAVDAGGVDVSVAGPQSSLHRR